MEYNVFGDVLNINDTLETAYQGVVGDFNESEIKHLCRSYGNVHNKEDFEKQVSEFAKSRGKNCLINKYDDENEKYIKEKFIEDLMTSAINDVFQ